MAQLFIHKKKLEHNYRFLDNLFIDHSIEWGVVSKLLCGNRNLITLLNDLGVTQLCDSRVSNLKLIKKINPEIQTVYIKPPAKRSIASIVKYADVSFNTELSTIQMLSQEAVKQGVVHKVIIMIELGDLREGVMGDKLVAFYAEVFKLKNIQVRGIGSNLNCMYGVMPSHDKLIQLSLYKQLIEATFKTEIPWVTGGTSVVIPLLLNRQLPQGINHFRVGETLFFGLNLFTGNLIEGLHGDIFELRAEIIEIAEKPVVPTGQLEANPSGVTFEVDTEDYGKTSLRAILDIGLLDLNPDFLLPADTNLQVLGASSDMIVLDLSSSTNAYKVGDTISFQLKYMGALGILNSTYIDKIIV